MTKILVCVSASVLQYLLFGYPHEVLNLMLCWSLSPPIFEHSKKKSIELENIQSIEFPPSLLPSLPTYRLMKSPHATAKYSQLFVYSFVTILLGRHIPSAQNVHTTLKDSLPSLNGTKQSWHVSRRICTKLLNFIEKALQNIKYS